MPPSENDNSMNYNMIGDVDLNVIVSNIIAENQYKNCRLCLKNLEDNYVRFYDHVSWDSPNGIVFQPLFELLTRLLDKNECEEVPGVDAVCTDCVEKVVDSISFIKRCENSTAILHSVIDSIAISLNNDVDISDKEQSLYIITNEKKSKAILVPKNDNIKDSVNKNNELKCFNCNTVYENLEVLEVHNLSIHGTLTCTVCYKTFVDSDKLNHHTATKHKVKCPDCGLSKSSEEGLRRHRDKVHTKFLCKDCGKPCHGLDKLHLHEHKHGSKSQCPKCGKSYHTKDFFIRHVKLCLEDKLDPHPIRSDTNKLYYCEKCGKGYSTPGGLRVHQRFTHENAKPHICKQCGKEFTAPSYLKIHMIKHTGEKNFKCSICGNNFVSKEALLYHTRRHTGEKPYSCKYCTEKFVNASTRAEHIKFKHIGAIWACDICQRKFVTLHLLKLHMNRHKDPTSKLYCGRNLIPPNVPGENNLRCKLKPHK